MPSARSSRLPSFTAATKTPKEAGSPAGRTRSQTFPLVRSKPSVRSLRSGGATDSLAVSPDQQDIIGDRATTADVPGAQAGPSAASPSGSRSFTDRPSPVVAGGLTESPEQESDAPLLQADISEEAEPKDTRPPQVLTLSGLERCDRPVWVAISDMLRTGSLRLRHPREKAAQARDPVRVKMDGSERDTSRSPPLDGVTGRRDQGLMDPEAGSADGSKHVGSSQSEEASGHDPASTEYDMRDTMVIWLRDEDASEKCPGWLVSHDGIALDPHI